VSGRPLRREENGTAVLVIVMALLIVVVLSFVTAVLRANSSYTYSAKLASELEAQRGKELLTVAAVGVGENRTVKLSNYGTEAAVIVAILEKRDGMRPAWQGLLVVPPLENRDIAVGTSGKLGALTALGNLFWGGT